MSYVDLTILKKQRPQRPGVFEDEAVQYHKSSKEWCRSSCTDVTRSGGENLNRRTIGKRWERDEDVQDTLMREWW